MCTVTGRPVAHDPLALRLRTQGLPLPGMDIRVVDPETRRPLPAGEEGELCVAGHVTPGYFRAPELTTAAFDSDGYFRTLQIPLLAGRDFDGGDRSGTLLVAIVNAELARREWPGLRVLYMTGYADAAGTNPDIGGDKLLKKPFHLPELQRAAAQTGKHLQDRPADRAREA